jgi:hypothetical protein
VVSHGKYPVLGTDNRPGRCAACVLVSVPNIHELHGDAVKSSDAVSH